MRMHRSLEKARDRAEDEIRSLRSLVDAMQCQVDELSHAQLWVQEKQRLCVCVCVCVLSLLLIPPPFSLLPLLPPPSPPSLCTKDAYHRVIRLVKRVYHNAPPRRDVQYLCICILSLLYSH